MKREFRTVDPSDQVDSPSQRHLPLVDLLVDTRAELMDLAVASGLKVLGTMLEEDRTAISGQRYQHQAGDAMLATGLSRLTQVQKDAGRAVDALTRDERRPNQAKQPGILLAPVRDRLREPS